MLSDAEKELLRKPNIGHVATVGSDGAPHSTPVWIDVDDDYVIFNTARGRVKARNLERDQRVGLSIHDEQNVYNMVSIRGRVAEVTEDGADDHLDAMTRKYLGEDKYPWRNPQEVRVIVKIRPERVASQIM